LFKKREWDIIVLIYTILTCLFSIGFPLIVLLIDCLQIYLFVGCLTCNQLPYPIIFFIGFEVMRILTFCIFFCITKMKKDLFYYFMLLGFTTQSWILFNIYIDWKHQTGCGDPFLFFDFFCLIISVGVHYPWYLYVIHLIGSIFVFLNIILTGIMIILKWKFLQFKLVQFSNDNEQEMEEKNKEEIVAPLIVNTNDHVQYPI